MGTWNCLFDRCLVWIRAVCVGGAQLEVAPVSEMPDGRVPFNTWVLVVELSSGMSGDQ